MIREAKPKPPAAFVLRLSAAARWRPVLARLCREGEDGCRYGYHASDPEWAVEEALRWLAHTFPGAALRVEGLEERMPKRPIRKGGR